ncbi:MAG TPA: hypothetical protein PLQ11_10400, partial [Beijerinckiaceae bacterium]|nr:hypothetical protein [Beijerinckiaceae bacterium]
MSSAAASVPPPPPRAAEPSMEEILASIRKIISEDQKVLEARADAARNPELGSAEPVDDADSAVGEDDQDVLELPASAMRPQKSAPDVVPAAASAAPVQPEPVVAPVFVAPVSVA